MHRIAAFLDEEERNEEHALGGAFWDSGTEVFVNRGTNGRWHDVLTPDDVSRYETTARERLGDECAAWLATGRWEGWRPAR